MGRNTGVWCFIFCYSETAGNRLQEIKGTREKGKTERSAPGRMEDQANIDYQCKAWHRHKVELNTSISDHLGIFWAKIITHHCHRGVALTENTKGIQERDKQLIYVNRVTSLH